MQNKQFKYGEDTTLNLEVTPQQFIALRNAIGQAISLTEIKTLPEVRTYVSTKTGEPIKRVSKDQIKKGEVVEVTDPTATFDAGNLQISYDATKITIDMLGSNALLEGFFKQHIEEGLATEVEVESEA